MFAVQPPKMLVVRSWVQRQVLCVRHRIWHVDGSFSTCNALTLGCPQTGMELPAPERERQLLFLLFAHSAICAHSSAFWLCRAHAWFKGVDDLFGVPKLHLRVCQLYFQRDSSLLASQTSVRVDGKFDNITVERFLADIDDKRLHSTLVSDLLDFG
jgi:hypothetical protein